jgi:transposase-like protein
MDKLELQRMSKIVACISSLLKSTVEADQKYVVGALESSENLSKVLSDYNHKLKNGEQLTEKEVDKFFESYAELRQDLRDLSKTKTISSGSISFDQHQAKIAISPLEYEPDAAGNPLAKVTSTTSIEKLGLRDSDIPMNTSQFGNSRLMLGFLQAPSSAYEFQERAAVKNLAEFLEKNGNGSEAAKAELKELVEDLKKAERLPENKIVEHLEQISKQAGVEFAKADKAFTEGFTR